MSNIDSALQCVDKAREAMAHSDYEKVSIINIRLYDF